jgi:hypothetical protein
MPSIAVFLELKSLNPDGSVRQHHQQRARTHNRNWFNILTAIYGSIAQSPATFGAGYLGTKDTGGTARINSGGVLSTYEGHLSLADPSNATTYGILCGSSAAAESFEGVALTTRIAHGNGATQLNHQAQALSVPSYNSGTKVWTCNLFRILNNNTASNISINEVAHYANYTRPGPTAHITMIDRSVLGAPVVVVPTGQVTITYKHEFTFPA